MGRARSLGEETGLQQAARRVQAETSIEPDQRPAQDDDQRSAAASGWLPLRWQCGHLRHFNQAPALARGCRTNQTGCTNPTTAVLAELVKTAQAPRAGPRDRNGSPQDRGVVPNAQRVDDHLGLSDSHAQKRQRWSALPRRRENPAVTGEGCWLLELVRSIRVVSRKFGSPSSTPMS